MLIVTIKRVRETDYCNVTLILKRNSIERRLGAAHLKKMGHATPEFRGCGVYVCKRRVNFVNARVYYT